MRFIYNITILFLFSSIYSCSSNKSIAIDKTEAPFYTIDSVFLVTPSYQINDNDFTMSLELEKLKDVGEYYFPSSEELRVIVKDSKGVTVLNTGENKNFMTAISPLEPTELNRVREYVYSLSGISLFGDNNSIKIYLILPTKPENIVFTKIIKLQE
ncbi:MAG: hypothetical protein RIF34_05195 [Candidatus Kapaibacterium sp.]